ncbi:uncharacterized protein LOC111040580 [Myzus persicae]|uniref:uncharacterized protein LOC111040580 n=1 Tax=Myzus persicae TaxID=13164 RepID=UPI000B935D68|nr:uncharacterized protein LOC111040580 [Myzus persicae]
MSRQNTSQQVSGRKKRKLLIDGSDEISLDRNVDLCEDFDINVTKDSQTSLEGYRDLFGELIPPDECVSNEEVKNKLIKKTPASKKKKQPYEEILFNTPTRPKRLFIPTPKIMELMHEASKELYSLMGARLSSSNVSIVSTDNLNVSGIQHLQDSPRTSIKNESKINIEEDDNDQKSQKVLEGVVAFIDYKVDNNRSNTSINQRLIDLGAKVEKTFNRKVTHVMFCDGYRSTYKKAVERNIPLVSARWMEYSKLANKIQDPADYPPVGMDKYTTMPSRNIIIPKISTSYKKFLDPSNMERDRLIKTNCDNLMKQFNLSRNHNVENGERCPIIETPEKTTVNKQDDVENILSDQLCKELKKIVVLDEQIDKLNVPTSIKTLRNYLTPDVKEKTISKDIYGQIAKIEDQLNLNFQAKKRFRMLLFPSDKDLNNIDEVSDLSTQTKDNDSGTMFINSMTIRTPEVFLNDDVRVQSIACTGIIKSEVKILKSFIENLGKFIFHTEVKPTTTYLITKSISSQSLDIVFAMANGCYIVSEDWVLQSYSIGRWLSHQKYLIPELSEPVKDFQIRRHTVFGSDLKFNIFNNAGKIYVSNSCESPAKLLRRLVHACGGHCTSKESKADIVIGANTLQSRHNIHEKWIFDCITQGVLLNKYQYNYVHSSE